MNDSSLLFESLWLMVIGMGIVYGFLLLLVGILRLMSRVALRLAPDEPPPAPLAHRSIGSGDSEDLIAVISAAIARYRHPR
ncbi:OadG family protein [Thiocystis violacea]|uniref:OadG family protein n=1 Tax=Thiocystis violacea TaxID=13725 RepID=UPI0019074468|nr:OadG family protein [Thiocystis violacea]MBK1716402.1 sodium pump decarboxylase subunit gamma [Thiocystis violacea]